MNEPNSQVPADHPFSLLLRWVDRNSDCISPEDAEWVRGCAERGYQFLTEGNLFWRLELSGLIAGSSPLSVPNRDPRNPWVELNCLARGLELRYMKEEEATRAPTEDER